MVASGIFAVALPEDSSDQEPSFGSMPKVVAIALAVALHAAGLYWLAEQKETPIVNAPAVAVTMTAQWLVAPAPDPAAAAVRTPVAEPVKPKPVAKPRPTVERPTTKPQPADVRPAPQPQAQPDAAPVLDAASSTQTQPAVPAALPEATATAALAAGPAAVEVEEVAARFDAAYLNNPEPTYPLASRQRGEQGTVRLRVMVKADGMAQSVEIAQSSGYVRLDRAAQNVVQKSWRFVPAKYKGVPVAGSVIVPISFHLQ